MHVWHVTGFYVILSYFFGDRLLRSVVFYLYDLHAYPTLKKLKNSNDIYVVEGFFFLFLNNVEEWV